jgi:hypothetical protein
MGVPEDIQHDTASGAQQQPTAQNPPLSSPEPEKDPKKDGIHDSEPTEKAQLKNYLVRVDSGGRARAFDCLLNV